MSTRAPRTKNNQDARSLAAEVLTRVESDNAFAAAVLDTALDRAQELDPRERAFATELVYGTLRCLVALDKSLGKHCKNGEKSLSRLDPWARAVLRVAAYQLLALERVPPHAAVSAAVQALRTQRSPGLAGFANAVLRKLALDRPDPLPSTARVDLALTAIPKTVHERVSALVGEARAVDHFRAALTHTSELSLRVNTHRVSREALRERLLRELPEAESSLGTLSPWCLRVRNAPALTRCAAWHEGLFSIQDEAAQSIAVMTAVRPEMKVLDACAGRGGKTSAIAMLLDGRGVLHAVDSHPAKLERAREELRRAGLDKGIIFEAFSADLTVGLGALEACVPDGGYDVVLLDAPCSGLGTVARRPDVMLRLRQPEAFAALVDTQRRLAERVAPLVKHGGVFVFAVCTLTIEESDGVIEAIEREHPGFFAPERERRIFTAERDRTDGFVVHRRVRAGAW